MLTWTSGDHPKTSVLTEVCVIRKLKKATVHLIMHSVKATPIPRRYT